MLKQETGSTRLDQILSQMNQEGGFPITVLTDAQGLSIASAADSGTDPERQSAVVAFVQKAAIQVTRQLGLGTTSEITLHDEKGQRLICRPFQVNGHELILAALAPNKNSAYRRVTNNAIAEIRRTWKQYWE